MQCFADDGHCWRKDVLHNVSCMLNTGLSAVFGMDGLPTEHHGAVRTSHAHMDIGWDKLYCFVFVFSQDKTPDFDTYCMLGEAFLAIQEPDKAVRAFESALELNPKDAELAVKCAQALVTAHDYSGAVDYFNKAIRNDPGKVILGLASNALLSVWRNDLSPLVPRPADISYACTMYIYTYAVCYQLNASVGTYQHIMLDVHGNVFITL